MKEKKPVLRARMTRKCAFPISFSPKMSNFVKVNGEISEPQNVELSDNISINKSKKGEKPIAD